MKKTTVSLEKSIFYKANKISDVCSFFFERGRVRRPDPLTMKKTTVSLYQLDILIINRTSLYSKFLTIDYRKKFPDVRFFFERGRVRRPDPLTMKKTTVSFDLSQNISYTFYSDFRKKHLNIPLKLFLIRI